MCLIGIFNLIVLLVSTQNAKREKCINGKTSVLTFPSVQALKAQGKSARVGRMDIDSYPLKHLLCTHQFAV